MGTTVHVGQKCGLLVTDILHRLCIEVLEVRAAAALNRVATEPAGMSSVRLEGR
jgi:hypothetical protein